MATNNTDPASVADAELAFERGYAADRAYRDELAAHPGLGSPVSAEVGHGDGWSPVPVGLGHQVLPEVLAQHQSDQPGEAGQPAPPPPLVMAGPAGLGMAHAEALGHAWPGQAAAESPMIYVGAGDAGAPRRRRSVWRKITGRA